MGSLLRCLRLWIYERTLVIHVQRRSIYSFQVDVAEVRIYELWVVSSLDGLGLASQNYTFEEDLCDTLGL